MIYFTSDLHFYHDNIISHTNRPFKNSKEMNHKLVGNWNRKVASQDEVYILGDVTMKGPVYAEEILSQLRGRKYLIKGNHDKFVEHRDFNQQIFEWVKDYHELTYRNIRFILFHYPIAEWNGFFREAIQLHGHQHNHDKYNYDNLASGLRRYDVGVDANYMAPVSIDDIIEFFTMEI